MIHKIISTFGLGILGMDPMTAILILSMNLRNDKKIKISAFTFVFAFFSIIFGALIGTIFGVTAIDYIKSLIPGDDSKFWLILELIVLIIILLWVFKRIFIKEKKDEKEENVISGSIIEYGVAGFLFALTCFTDPTYYAVILTACETKSFLLSLLLLTIWFVVSQWMTIVVYVAGEFNFLDKIVKLKDKIVSKYSKKFNIIFNIILVIIALLLILDIGTYMVIGKYLF